MAEEFDREEFLDELAERMTDELEDRMSDEMEAIVQDALSATLPELVRESLQDFFADYVFRLPDGTQVMPRERLKLLSPDKTKQLVCAGGLRVSDTSFWSNCPKGWALKVQTRISSWEIIHIWSEKAEAVAALEMASHAMEEGKHFLWLGDTLAASREKALDNAKELRPILERFATSGWDLIASPSQMWLDGNPDLPMLRNAILQAEKECGSCGCELDPLYKRALQLL